MFSHVFTYRVLSKFIIVTLLTCLNACQSAINLHSDKKRNEQLILEGKGAEFPASFLLLSPTLMSNNKSNFSNTNKPLVLNQLIENADKYLDLVPPTIANKSQLPDSGKVNDYMSTGPYWWPNSETADGLPWIRKDGEVNPITRHQDNDKAQFRMFTKALKTLGYAYFYTGDRRYAEKAQSLLDVWFVDKSTRMNPNLNFAQSVPGRSNGRGFGIIEFVELPHILDAIYLLKDELTPLSKLALKTWFQDFTHWMTYSENGIDESNAKNNHGSFYNLLMLSFHTSLGQFEKGQVYLEKAKILMNQQIEEQGSQPHELARTKPYNYSIYNLRALFSTAKIAEQYGQSLWYETPALNAVPKKSQVSLPGHQTSKLHSGLNYIFELSPIGQRAEQWQDMQKFKVDYSRIVSLVALASSAYPNFVERLSTLPSSIKMTEQKLTCNLLFGEVNVSDVELNEVGANYSKQPNLNGNRAGQKLCVL